MKATSTSRHWGARRNGKTLRRDASMPQSGLDPISDSGPLGRAAVRSVPRSGRAEVARPRAPLSQRISTSARSSRTGRCQLFPRAPHHRLPTPNQPGVRTAAPIRPDSQRHGPPENTRRISTTRLLRAWHHYVSSERPRPVSLGAPGQGLGAPSWSRCRRSDATRPAVRLSPAAQSARRGRGGGPSCAMKSAAGATA
jgi:hypothetical protein